MKIPHINKSLLVLLVIVISASVMFFISGYSQTKILVPSPAPSPMILISKYPCPKTGWINCMPILTEERKKLCLPEAISWYKKNCPEFKGATY